MYAALLAYMQVTEKYVSVLSLLAQNGFFPD